MAGTLTRPAHYETTDVRIDKLVVGPYENNVFVLRDKGTGEAVLVDAANEHELLLEVSRATGVRRVLTTHGHFDHIQAVTADARRRASTSASPPRTPRCCPATTSPSPTTRSSRSATCACARSTPPATPRAPPASCSRATRCCSAATPSSPAASATPSLRGRRLPHDHPLGRRAPLPAPGRDARSPRPRARHHDRHRASAPRRVGRTGLVARPPAFVSFSGLSPHFSTNAERDPGQVPRTSR